VVTARGIPRTINICCDNALINGYGYAAEQISLKIAHESCRALQFGPSFRRVAILATAAAVLVCILFSGDVLLRRFLAAPAGGQVQESAWRDRTSVHKADVEEAHAAATVAAPLPSPRPTAEPHQASLASVTEAATASPPALRAEVSPAPPLGTVRTAAIATPAPTVPTSAATETKNHQDPQAAWKWFVRKGDTVYKACRVTYGQCDEQLLSAVIAYNPQIASHGVIRQGMVIIMPEHIEPVRSN
jgi:phage tail protein X